MVFNYIIILHTAFMEIERCKYASLKGRSTVQKIGRAKADFFLEADGVYEYFARVLCMT